MANDILIPELARLLEEEKEVRFTPSGVSMRPFIEGEKDSVIIAPYTRAPRRGDIVLARATAANGKTTYVLHRIIRIETPSEEGKEAVSYILQGDGNLSGEEICRKEDIIGRVTAILNPKGHRKILTCGCLWMAFRPCRNFLLKIYRHTLL